jgi:hypothetical protein
VTPALKPEDIHARTVIVARRGGEAMNRSVRRSLLSVAFVLPCSLALAHPDHPDQPCDSISTARAQPLGTSVEVLGTVTVPPGAFDGGFAIQAGADGIYVLDAAGASLRVGDVARVTGTLVDNSGLLAIQPVSVKFLFGAQPVKPQHSATGAVGEATEARLLHLHGTMVGPLVDDSPFGFKLDIDDGSGPIQIFLYPGTGIPTDGLVEGASVDTVCFSNQFEATYECDPASPESFRVGSARPRHRPH